MLTLMGESQITEVYFRGDETDINVKKNITDINVCLCMCVSVKCMSVAKNRLFIYLLIMQFVALTHH